MYAVSVDVIAGPAAADLPEPGGRAPAPAPGLNGVQDFVNTNDIEGEHDRLATPELLGEWLAARGALRPGERVLGEEEGDDGGAVRWILDPIDGTHNYVRGIPVWATLVAVERAGVLLALDGLHPHSEATRVTFAGGKAQVTDGPFAEAKEVLGGYWMIEVRSRDEAIQWATRCPAGDNEMIELRQVFEMSEFPADVQEAVGDFKL